MVTKTLRSPRDRPRGPLCGRPTVEPVKLPHRRTAPPPACPAAGPTTYSSPWPRDMVLNEVLLGHARSPQRVTPALDVLRRRRVLAHQYTVVCSETPAPGDFWARPSLSQGFWPVRAADGHGLAARLRDSPHRVGLWDTGLLVAGGEVGASQNHPHLPDGRLGRDLVPLIRTHHLRGASGR